MRIRTVTETISSWIERLIKVSIITALGGIVFFVNLAVFFRYVLSDPLTWTNEISSYLLVYVVIFGAAIALRQNQFVKVEALLNLLPPGLKQAIFLLTQTLIAAFLVVCIGSPTMLIEKAIITQTISPALGIPMVYLYRMLRIGFAAMLFFVIMNMLERLIDARDGNNLKERPV